MKTIAVIGGTGMLGKPVAKQLKADGFEVRIISRDRNKAMHTLGEGFDFKQADVFDVPSLTLALQGCDGIHINLTGDSPKSYYRNHVLGTKNILKAVAHQDIKKISMISTASAYPENDFRADTQYKLEAELLLKKSGIPYLVFLPSWFMETLPLFKQNNKMVQMGKSTKKIHWQSAQDYSFHVSQAFQEDECVNKRITILGPQGLTMKEAIQIFAQHQNLTYQYMPLWFTKMFAWISRDTGLKDAADLLHYYEKVGEKAPEDILLLGNNNSVLRTQEKLDDWLNKMTRNE